MSKSYLVETVVNTLPDALCKVFYEHYEIRLWPRTHIFKSTHGSEVHARVE